MRSVLLLSLVSSSLAIQLPFKVPFFQSRFSAEDENSVHETPRVAIIGAGAAGSSAAFWISKAQERFGVNVEVDVYERSSYIGGRKLSYFLNFCLLEYRLQLIGSTTVFPHDDPSFPPVELGASIYVQSNKNMVRAAEAFNLSTKPFDDEEGTFGVWDGEQVIVQVGFLSQNVDISQSQSVVKEWWWLVGYTQACLEIWIHVSETRKFDVSSLYWFMRCQPT